MFIPVISVIQHTVTLLKPIRALRCTCGVHLRSDTEHELYAQGVKHATQQEIFLAINNSSRLHWAHELATTLVVKHISHHSATERVLEINGPFLSHVLTIFVNDVARGWPLTAEMLSFTMDSIHYPAQRAKAAAERRTLGVGA